VTGIGTLRSNGLQCGLHTSRVMALSGRVAHEVVDVQCDKIACGFCGR
jgi:hypothetical protein